MPSPIYNLQTKHQLFVDAYLKSMNATQSAKDAGFSHKSASVQGWKLLQRDDVKRAIALGKKSEFEVVALAKEIDEDRIILELWDKVDDTKPGRTHAASVSALRLLSDIKGLTKGAAQDSGIKQLRALTVRIRSADGSTVEVIQGSVEGGASKAIQQSVSTEPAELIEAEEVSYDEIDCEVDL